MCGPPKPPPPTPIPERQAMQLPDGGATTPRTDDIAKRRRGMLATVMTSPLGLSTAPSTTSSNLGG